jgi:hypothetical protein
MLLPPPRPEHNDRAVRDEERLCGLRAVRVVHSGKAFAAQDHCPTCAASCGSAAAGEWQSLQVPVSRDAAGQWIIQEQAGGTAVLERRGRHVLAVSGGGDDLETLQSLLRGAVEESQLR